MIPLTKSILCDFEKKAKVTYSQFEVITTKTFFK